MVGFCLKRLPQRATQRHRYQTLNWQALLTTQQEAIITAYGSDMVGQQHG